MAAYVNAQAIHPNATPVAPAFPPHLFPHHARQRKNSSTKYPIVSSGTFTDFVTKVLRGEPLWLFQLSLQFYLPNFPTISSKVNTQYPIRPSVEVGQQPHDLSISIGSIGELHAARQTPREKNVKFPDFVFTKAFPRRMQNPRVNMPFGIVEIKTSMHDEADIQGEKVTAYEAMDQINDYTTRLSQAAFAVHELDTAIIASYLVYGKYYAKVVWNGSVYTLTPWQFIMEEMALPDRAPFLYRLCELAVTN
ncbi:hypothetical protein D9615_007569 [Tricholomella constricta]|uniref:Uncharacterized protein n=1 Tax=Tricholomella constricta TaxID=117010 RepID=A0A8H5H7C9_9AGAR|nr:hypothetical protein D9615_007569 [Tricholomella constricta]